MKPYMYALKNALLLVPIVSLIFLIIYIKQDKTKINHKKMISLYFFILYIIVMYFLVIFPLPPISEVKNYTSNYVQLEPLYTIRYLKENMSFNVFNIDSYIRLIKNAYFYQFIYNILITVPFGMYLKKYFRLNLFKTILSTFILSLFFELTQLSGLYGVYLRPYRIFDVDDLITNTFGGIIGYFIGDIINKTRKKF